MGLAASQSRFLFLTARKADCEYNISIDSMKKMALTREQSDLSKEYYSRLQSKQIAYRADGKYNNMTYQYLMGYGSGSSLVSGVNPIKTDNSMILTDCNGLVVLGSTYVNALTSVLGDSCMDAKGRGGTFSADLIPELIAAVAGSPCNNAEDIKTVMNGGEIAGSYDATTLKTMSQTVVGSTEHDSTASMTDLFKQVIDFYYPIFHAASANGFTTEYNNEISNNSNYVSDALVSGSLQLVQVNDYGNYDPDTSLTYFITTGLVSERQDSSVREEITAWYNAEKERINEKESWLDLELSDLSTELEAIKTEIESVKSMIEDGQKVFEWGS